MYILAFETSCDDTSVALMEDDICLALSTRTQLEHIQTGGVVPEVAARSHANAIFPCLEDVLRETGLMLHQIDLIACTSTPGLMPSLLTGMTVAKTLALSLKRPLFWIHHIESHIFANYLERTSEDIPFPAVVLTVSGGHTEIYHWTDRYTLSMIGQTRDDAAGEAFDKVSKMLGLGFPGGAIISKYASEYTGPYKKIFPKVLLEKGTLDFSFSGLKTAVRREIDLRTSLGDGLTIQDIREIAYEFESVMVDILTAKILYAQIQTNSKSIVLAGGVSANTKLRDRLELESGKIGIPFFAPKKMVYSMDNAAMIGIRAYYEWLRSNPSS